jgi:uroporphyrinogen III methyltransferase/synthase
MRPAPGTVQLVGAGPGDPGLLTLRGAQCLQHADVVVYDYLANPAVLEHAAPSAELVPLGPRGTAHYLRPDEITRRLVAEARAGRAVVRLKGGDPTVFGRLADEMEALEGAGIPFEIVPGITTGLAVGAYCEIPLTQQETASAVALVTGRERNAKEDSSLDYGALASFPGTLVFYMGVARSAEWSRALMDGGKPPGTPVGIVRWCSRTRQEMVRCTLGTVADVVAARDLRPPAVIVVGDVVDRAPERSWFSARPLFGTRVLLSGSPATSRTLSRELSARGAEVLTAPAIRIVPPPDWRDVDAALDGMAGYDWIVFSSANGVDALMGRLLDRGLDARALGGVKIAAMGSETEKRLAGHHLRADLVPDEFVAESMARALVGRGAGRRVLLVRANRGRRVLAEALTEVGAEVAEVAAYRSVDVEEPDAGVARDLAAGEIDWITVTSGAVARSLHSLYGPALSEARLASIGPIASAALRELGLEPEVEAVPHTAAALVEALVHASPGPAAAGSGPSPRRP